MNKKRVDNMITELTDRQRKGILKGFEAIQALRDGTASAEEIAQAFTSIPAEDVPGIMEVLQAMED